MANPADQGKEFWNANYSEPKSKRKVANNRVECEFCGKYFHRYALYRHRRDVHNPIVCVCQVCNTKFKSKEYLQRHMQYKHGVGSKNLTCESCNKTFRSEVSLQSHQCPGIKAPEPSKNGDNKVTISCDICGKGFGCDQSLQKHKVLFHSQPNHPSSIWNPIQWNPLV